MNKSKIEWLDGGYTWNPVTGCLHGCEYCYARKIARRFSKSGYFEGTIHELFDPNKLSGLRGDPFPYSFDPTFHRYRLDEPQKIKKPQNIFVCSMADLFGEWVPDEWIQQVFEACEKAPWHRYLFLTKNPDRYIELVGKGLLPKEINYWFGTTATTKSDHAFWSLERNYFISIEPLMMDFSDCDFEAERIGGARIWPGWVIVGAETGNRKGKVIPKREWIENIVSECRKQNVPVFLKDSLAKIWGEPLIREYPWREKVCQ